MARAAWDLAVALRQSGVTIEVLTTPVPGYASSFVADGIPVQTVCGAAAARYSARWWLGTAMTRHVTGADAVLSVSSGATTMMWLRRGPRYIFQLHGTSVQELRGALIVHPPLWWLRCARLAYWSIVESLTFARSDAVVAVSDQVAAALRRWPYRVAWRRRRLLLVPNPVNADLFRTSAELRQASRVRLGLEPSDVVAVTVSRLARQKGVDQCLRAVAATPQHVKLMVVGSGPEEEALHQEAHSLGVLDRVLFLGECDHAHLPATLAAADVFVFPVRAFAREGLPIAVLEALAAGLRVIVPDGSAWPEDIREWLDPLPVHDAQVLAEALRSTGAHPAPRVSRLPSSYGVSAVAASYGELIFAAKDTAPAGVGRG